MTTKQKLNIVGLVIICAVLLALSGCTTCDQGTYGFDDVKLAMEMNDGRTNVDL